MKALKAFIIAVLVLIVGNTIFWFLIHPIGKFKEPHEQIKKELQRVKEDNAKESMKAQRLVEQEETLKRKEQYYEKKKAEEARRNAERAEQQRIAEQRREEERKRALEEEKIRAQKQKELSYKREDLKRAIEQEENILSNLIRAQKDRYNRLLFDAKVALDRFNDRRVAEIYRKEAERMKDQDQLVIDSLREKIDDMKKKLQILE